MMNKSLDPVIVVGMHRSGTSIVSRVLDELGVFMGCQVNEDHEARFFLKLNCWMFEQHGCRWDQPGGFSAIVENADIRNVAMKYLEIKMKGPMAASYVGIRRYAFGEHPLNMRRRWGWKDPRNTFVLPLWLDLFPKARVLHVKRHGIDVAASLYRRENHTAGLMNSRRQRLFGSYARWLYLVYDMKSGLINAPRCLTLPGAFSLWEEYIDAAQSSVDALGSQAMSIRFEDLLKSPRTVLEQLCDFLGIETSGIDGALAMLEPSRRYAFRSNAELARYAESSSESLRRRGYSALGA